MELADRKTLQTHPFLVTTDIDSSGVRKS